MRSIRSAIILLAFVPVLPAGCGGNSGPPRDDDSSAKSPPAAKSHAVGDPSNQPAVAFNVRFQEMPAKQTGVTFQHVSGDSAIKPFPAANGSGVGAFDFDLDGRCDLYFATGTPFPLDAKRERPVNRCYRNLGDWRFEEVTAESRLGHNGYSAGVAVGDFDADGLPDVYVTCYGRNVLYRNQGDGTFEPLATSPDDGGNFSTSAAFLDYDGDGLLDLYICNYGKWSLETNRFCGNKKKNVRIFCSPKSLEPEADVLLRNEGDGRFRNVSRQAGLAERAGRGQGVLAADVNADGHIDLYLGNDIHPNLLYLNDGNGRFRDVSESSGASYDRAGRMQAGMGVAGADINRDGRWDLFVTNFEGEYHTLYLQAGRETFHDVSQSRGLAAASRLWVGWGTAFVDFDHDGWKDLIVTNGHVDNNLNEMGRDSPYDHPALVWKNVKGRFHFLSEAAGDYFRKPHPGRGLAVADLDNDGDSDVVITQQDQPPALLRTDRRKMKNDRPDSAALRLIGRRSNRDAIGSRIEIDPAGQPPRLEQVQGGGSYLSAHDRRIIIALPNGRPARATVHWPSGQTSVVNDIRPGKLYDIIEPARSGRAVVLTQSISYP